MGLQRFIELSTLSYGSTQSGDNAGETEDWVSSEAMDIALEALQSVFVPTLNISSASMVLPTIEG
jgi:hypothetical protein